jgi:hypothetical protein
MNGDGKLEDGTDIHEIVGVGGHGCDVGVGDMV